MNTKTAVAYLCGLLACGALLGAAAPARAGQPGDVMTKLDPAVHGFYFVNQFTSDVMFDIRMDGLCSGMSYTVLDYYNAKKPIANQFYMPQRGSPLESFIYARQISYMKDNADKWVEVGSNPGGVRNAEFFSWGLKGSGGGRLQELQQSIDRGVPAVLGLKSTGSADHAVIAIGYNLGRYKGDLGAFREDLKIYVLDPNHSREVLTMVPDLANLWYKYTKPEYKETFRTYLVDSKYRATPPPAVGPTTYPADGKVHEVVLYLKTGADDMRGGNDNLNLRLNFASGYQQTLNNANLGARWIPGYFQYVPIRLDRPVPKEEILSAVLSTTFGGGWGGDNWDLAQLTVYGVDANGHTTLYDQNGNPLYRFTGSNKTFTAELKKPDVVAGKVGIVTLDIRTGNDDLRGGNDNLNVAVLFKDNTRQKADNVNKGMRWADRTSTKVQILLNRAMAPEDIVGIELTTTFGGGWGGDNWNMDWLRVTLNGPNFSKIAYDKVGSPLNRFTGDQKSFTARW